jgi:hypothetical protein
MSHRASDRAEARRRARAAARRSARGEVVEPDDQETVEETEPQGGFLRRMFPTAPPLPGKPPPLEGFTYTGPLRPVVERLWLLARNPLLWVLPGLFWGLGRLANPGTALGFIVSFLTFGAPLAAGWFGWRRPPLYGAATAFIGYLGVTGLALYFFVSQGVSLGDLGEPSTVLIDLVVQMVLYTAMGYVLGWYGGYLRRRQAMVRSERRPGR